MNTIPAHLQAILSGSVTLRAVAPVVAPRDRAPVFAPAQSGAPRSVRSLSRTIEDMEAPEVHTIEAPEDCERFALVPSDL